MKNLLFSLGLVFASFIGMSQINNPFTCDFLITFYCSGDAPCNNDCSIQVCVPGGFMGFPFPAACSSGCQYDVAIICPSDGCPVYCGSGIPSDGGCVMVSHSGCSGLNPIESENFQSPCMGCSGPYSADWSTAATLNLY